MKTLLWVTATLPAILAKTIGPIQQFPLGVLGWSLVKRAVFLLTFPVTHALMARYRLHEVIGLTPAALRDGLLIAHLGSTPSTSRLTPFPLL